MITNLLNQRVRLQATLENLENPSILRQVKSYNFERQTSEKLTFQVRIGDGSSLMHQNNVCVNSRWLT